MAVGLVSTAANAQTKPKPLATPLPVLTGAEIISRAGDQLELVAVPQPVENTGEPVTLSESARIKELNERIKKLESGQKVDENEKQKRLLLNLDIITRAEQRSESLRKQLFEMIEKETAVKSRIEQISFDIRPEMIERSLQMSGSFRPEEVRDARKKSLAAERQNLESLLSEIQTTRTNITFNLQKSDVMVEKLRTKLEKDIDDSFLNDVNN